MPQVIRVRTKEGLFRYNVEPTDDVSNLLSQLKISIPNADFDTLTLGNQPTGGPTMKANELGGNTIADLGLKHGHLLYASFADSASAAAAAAAAEAPAHPTAGPSAPTQTNGASSSKATAAAAPKKPWELVQEESIDTYWSKQDGKIPRSRDSKFCRHGAQGMCDYCMPLEPYDARYHAEHSIKHLSFHAHLRKLDAGANKGQAQGSTWIPPLEEADYSVKVPCPSGQHPSWPSGICTKCQPSAITLQRQTYRMVDHVEFSHPDLIENLLKFWRSTAVQRFGFLLGRYEPYADVPMGVKAVVEAIHEPPQEGELDGVTIGVPWEEQGRVEQLARQAGLQFVGMIYSDLTPEPIKEEDKDKPDARPSGRVLCKRHKDSFFLSGCEVLFAATLQQANATPCRFSASGRYNSRFVTCVLSGNADGEIGVEAYQVSEQTMAMVRADMIEASVSPNVIRVKPDETGKRYVPEVFFRYKNKYGLDVKESAKPTFPVEYLIVNVTNGFPTQASPRFLSSKFPIENRQGLSDQDMSLFFRDLTRVLKGQELQPISAPDAKGKGRADAAQAQAEMRQELVALLSDWHPLAFLQGTGFVGEEELKAMLDVAVSHDAGEALDRLVALSGWKTLVAIAKEQGGSSGSGQASGGGGGGGFGASFGDALDDELTPEEIAAIIASTEASGGGGGDGSGGGGETMPVSPANFESAQSSRRPSAVPPPLSHHASTTTTSTSTSTSRTNNSSAGAGAIGRSATAIHPVDSADARRAVDEFEYTGDDDFDYDDVIDVDDDDEDDDATFDDALEEDDGDVQMTRAPASASRTRTAPVPAPATTTRGRAQPQPQPQVMDMTQEDDDDDAGFDDEDEDLEPQKQCPTCSVNNPIDADTRHLCGLPMNL